MTTIDACWRFSPTPPASVDKRAAAIVLAEAIDERFPPRSIDPAVEQHVIDALLLQPPDQQLEHPHPLAEHDDLRARLLEQLVEQRRQFVGFDAKVRLVVQQVRAVAAHPHVLQGDHQAA